MAEVRTRRCRGCPEVFELVHGHQRFCGRPCRERYWHKSRRPARACQECEGVFVPLRSNRTVFCTVLCKRRESWRRHARAHLARQRERYRTDPEYRERRVRRERERYWARGPGRLRRGSHKWAAEVLGIVRR